MSNTSLNVEVLISCMYQRDTSIIQKTNIQTNVVVINQCDKNEIENFSFYNKFGEKCDVKFISTTERGLSKSRNMAIRYATGDICLICDDDEVLEDNYKETIQNAYKKNQEDILAFRVKHPTRSFKNYPYKIGYFNLGTLGSWQLSFVRNKILEKSILFNENMGSGTGHGAGEENKFLMDCFKCHLKIKYVPDLIGGIIPSGESQWFNGYTEQYWINRGWQSKMIYGILMGYLHIWQSVIRHKRDKEHSLWEKIKWVHRGFSLKR